MRPTPRPHHPARPFLLAVAALIAACAQTEDARTPQTEDARTRAATVAGSAPGSLALAPPPTERSDHADVYHGVEVADPYRWLEEAESDETRRWIEDQNDVTFAFLEALPRRAAIHARLEELRDYERVTTPQKEGGRYFVRRIEGLQAQPVVYDAESIDGPWRKLLDPGELSEDGTIAVAGLSPSPDGRWLAYGIQDGGSDWRELHVLELSTGEPAADVVRNVKFGGGDWAADSSGFFYSRFERPATGELQTRNDPPETYFHRLGTAESEDTLVLERHSDPRIMQGFALTEARDAAVISRWDTQAQKTELDWARLTPTDGGWALTERRPLAAGFDAQHGFVGDDGRVLWIKTDLDAPNGRVLAIDPTNPAREHWVEVVPQGRDAIESVSAVGGRLLVRYLRHATSRVEVLEPDGTPVRSVDLPGIGSAWGFSGHFDDPETFFTFTSFTQPATGWRYDVATGERSPFEHPELPYDASAFVERQVFFPSRDGTLIPMFLVHRRGIALDSSHPTYLNGYGGFNVSLTPYFSEDSLAWLELGGILAVPNLRGGGEYGEAWHEAGIVLSKQNVFDDFIAAAEWLIDSGYTSSERLAIGGGSNGGLLVGVCMTQRPELYAAALPAVGVMDMLRYHEFTIGWVWAGDYGTSADPDQFAALLAYSPYHNLRAASYPATLVTTADRDDRVVPAHSFKFAAALQHAQEGAAPCLIRIETRAGHGGGKPTAMRIEETADRWAFLAWALGMD